MDVVVGLRGLHAVGHGVGEVRAKPIVVQGPKLRHGIVSEYVGGNFPLEVLKSKIRV